MDYLPNNATIDEACEWLQHQTGQKWTLPRLLEDGHLTPYVWIDYAPGLPQIFGDRLEGYLTMMVYHGDVMRLAADRNEALLTMFTAHDGTLARTEPGWRVELKDVRFQKEDIKRVAEIINKTAPAQNNATPAPLVPLEAQRGYVLTLPSGQTHVQFGELADLIADALWPDMGTNDTRMTYGCTRVNLDAELVRAVKSGTLQVKDPLTFGPHTFPVGNALLSALVSVDDLREFVAGRGLKVETVQTHTTPSPAPVVADEFAFDMVATRKELIDAFGKFTGMSLAWFDNLNDSPKLKAARKYTGQGGRHSAEPLFCPYEVMQWLADPKRKKGKQLSETTAWRLLKESFGKVYNQYSIGDPNAN